MEPILTAPGEPEPTWENCRKNCGVRSGNCAGCRARWRSSGRPPEAGAAPGARCFLYRDYCLPPLSFLPALSSMLL